jgi:hypothetical protein
MDKHPYKQIKKVCEWLGEYSEPDVDSIISYYEESKGAEEKLKKYYRNRQLHEQQEAEESVLLCLEAILHKKLFNAQCLWLAHELELPLKSTWSIHKYSHNLFEATFLEPITQEELDAFIGYYLSDDYEPFNSIIAQNHEKLVAYALGQKYHSPLEAFDRLLHPDPHYPHWYAWYDRHFGTGDLVKLPDHRAEAEQVLLSAYSKKKGIDMSGVIEGFQNIDKIKPLVAYHPEFLAFAEHIEDYRMRTFFKTQTEHIYEAKTDEGKMWINYLEDMLYQEIPISAADDWRDAVCDAGFRHLQQNTVKRLPEYYDQYLHDTDFRSRYFNEKKWKSEEKSEDAWQEMLIEGREYLEQQRKDNPEK